MNEKEFCIWCGKKPAFEDADMCTRCWELDSRIGSDPEIARRILDAVDVEKKVETN